MQKPLSTNDVPLWRQRAKEARALAEQITDDDARFRLLRIATDYDKLAQQVEREGLKR